jgi:predicted O-methyltransferase YrrM
MSEERWNAVDAFIGAAVLAPDPVLDATLAASRRAGLPEIAVSPAQGALLDLLARLRGARRILEIGTLGGYSAIWLGRALPPGGQLVTIEADPRHAEVATANLARAGLREVVDVRVGRALDVLPRLAGEPAFDLVFIDADKPSNPAYFRWALRLTGPGSLIVIDNVVRGGAVADADSADEAVRGSRRVLELIGSEPSVTGTVVQTVGVKGYDGLALAVVGPTEARR